MKQERKQKQRRREKQNTNTSKRRKGRNEREKKGHVQASLRHVVGPVTKSPELPRWLSANEKSRGMDGNDGECIEIFEAPEEWSAMEQPMAVHALCINVLHLRQVGHWAHQRQTTGDCAINKK